MFINLRQVKTSLEKLERVHPFYLLTFLVCKQAKLPVGKAIDFAINQEETEFLRQYYRPDTNSEYFYRVSRVGVRRKYWLEPDYASSGSQKTRTTTFKEAFIHPSETQWGWSPDYLEVLQSRLAGGSKIPAFDLATWVFRDRDWPEATAAEEILEALSQHFHLTPEEKNRLFDLSLPGTSRQDMFQPIQIQWRTLRRTLSIPPPKDSQPDEGGTLAFLRLNGVGPARELAIRPAERLNLITGDNGLGKTFLLECAWWALTGHWAGYAAVPRDYTSRSEPRITFEIASGAGDASENSVLYDWESQRWNREPGKNRPTIPGLLIYARVDGSFAVWDPAKAYWTAPVGASTGLEPGHFVFLGDDVWEGISQLSDGKTRVLCNGLLRDWISWQNKPDSQPFETLKEVLTCLSPPSFSDLGELKPGSPARLPYDAREIPTLRHPFGEVPILHASAGVKRIVAMAYLIVWAWEEHKAHSALIRRPPQSRIVILIDEMECHLHPQWQRAILPALLHVKDLLDPELLVQYLVATHSPLVMTSIEPLFSNDTDKLFKLDLAEKDLWGTSDVVLRELDFFRHGKADSWLMSDAFEDTSPRSIPATSAIDRAKALQQQVTPSAQEVQQVHEELSTLLGAEDEFWPRWVYWAEKHGAKI